MDRCPRYMGGRLDPMMEQAENNSEKLAGKRNSHLFAGAQIITCFSWVEIICWKSSENGKDP